MRKRILSFLLALSMVVSLLPAGAFAETSGSAPVQTRMFECQLEIGDNGLPMNGDHGTNWTYDSTNNILTLTGNPQITIDSGWDFSGDAAITCEVVVETGANISGGTFGKKVTNKGTISGGTFNGKVTNGTKGIIWNGTFNGLIENHGTIQGGTFSHPSGVNYYNYGTISGGTFEGGSYVCNYDNGVIAGGTFGASIVVDNRATIEKGTFHGKVANGYNGNSGNKGTIQGGTFYGEVTNNTGSTIEYGVFPAGLSRNNGTVNGGYFNGKNALPSDFHHVEVGNGKIVKMAGVETATGEWNDLYVRTDAAVLLTADVDITDIEGEAVTDVMLSDGGKTVNFNMRNHDIVLNKTSAPAPAYNTELVMGSDGKPDTTNAEPVGTNKWKGNGWTYEKDAVDQYGNYSNVLTLTSGSYDFSTTKPQSGNGETLREVSVKVVVGNGATVTGGCLQSYLDVESGGTIENCEAYVFINNYGTIKGGRFNGDVTNYGTIADGVFHDVTNTASGIITGGMFTSSDGVKNAGTIKGGFFEWGLSTDSTVLEVEGGYFHKDSNRKVPTNSHHVTVKDGVIREVCGKTIGEPWNLYVVKDTKVQLTAYTDFYGRPLNIATINDKAIGSDGAYTSSYVNGDKSTITFTMPDEDVVLEKATVTYRTELVIKDDGKPNTDDVQKVNGVYVGDDWTYDGDTLTLAYKEGGWDFSGGAALKCEVEVGQSATIKGGTFEKTVKNNGYIDGGTYKGAVENHGTIWDGVFAAGLTADSTGNVYDGYFGGDAKPANSFYSISVADGGKITAINNNDLTASVSDGWDKCWTCRTDVQIMADVNITNINGEKIGEGGTYRSDYVNGDKSTVTFTMPDEDVVLNKAYDTTLEIDSTTGLPVTDKRESYGNGGAKGDGWEYDGTTLTLTANPTDKSGWDFSGGAALKCEVEIGQGVTIKDGTFEETVTNHGTINSGIFAAGLTADSTGNVYDGYFGGDTKPADGFYSISVTDGGKLLKIDDNDLTASVPGGWEKCWTRQDTAKVKASVGIATIDGEKVGEVYSSYYVSGSDKTTVGFRMPAKNVVLGKLHDAPLVMKDGYPDTDGADEENGVWYGDGWEYNKTTETLTLTGGTAYYNGRMTFYVGYYFNKKNPMSSIYKGPTGEDAVSAVKCKIVVKGTGKYVKLMDGTFEETVTLETPEDGNSVIDGGTYKRAVTVEDGAGIDGGIFGSTVTNAGEIWNATFTGTVTNHGKIRNATFTGIVTNHGEIISGIFAAGLTADSTGNVYDGYFGTGTNLPDGFYSISMADGGKITAINNNDLTASVSGGWDKCWTCRTDVQITADVDITNINGEKIGEGGTYRSDYVNGNKSTVTFTMPDEDVVLNKNRTDGVLVMDPATGLPKVDDMEPETDGTYKTYKGNGWEYDADNKVLTLHGTYTGNVSYAYYDFTSTKPTHNLNEKGDGLVPEVNCEIVAEGGVQSSAGEPYSSYIVILNGGTFKEKVTLKGATSSDPSSAQSIISAGTFENEVEVCPGAAINGGTYTETSVINNKGFITMSVGSVSGALNNLDGGEITNGKFNIPIDNWSGGTITGGVFYAPIENNGTITGGIFFHALSGDVSGGILLLSAEETPAGTHRVTMDGDAKFVRVLSGIEEYQSGTVVAYLVNADELDGKNVYAYKGTQFGVALDQEITNLNGKAVGTIYESYYLWGKDPEGSVIEDKTEVCFTMPGEDVVLNKAAEPAPKPDEPGKDDPKAAQYTIKVDEYAKVNGKSSVTVKVGDTVSLTVSETPDGQTFDHWDLPSELQEALTKQDSTFNNSVKDLSFRMPDMGDTDAAFSIKTGFRSAELPADDSAPSALGTAAIVAVGGATAGILVWQGVSLGVDSYLQLSLPDGVAIPTNRRELVTLLWETAGKPEVALPALYNDVPAEDLALQKASRWAVANGLVGDADDEDASRFDPDHYVTKMDVFGAWLKLQKLLKNK